MRTELGKIQKVSFGHGGYQEACIGINFTLGGEGWGVGSSETAWDAEMIECTNNCKWTEEDRSKQYDEIVRYISRLLKEAKVSNVNDLEGVPIEATFDGQLLRDWRILTEVI
jgi:hypothetical protein